jgi:RHS repeat-associated protein
MSFEYDAVGNRTKRTDYSGRVTNYEYDNLNRLTTLLHGTTPESTYTYDDLSRLLTATNGAGTVTFTYNNRGLLESETDVFGRVLEYGYDANGNRTLLELDGNTHTTYAYDIANRLTTLTDDASQSYTYGYDIADRLISKALPNGITTTFDYDGLSRLTRLQDATVGSTLLDRQYSYNTANQISAITEPSRTRAFGYDNVNRLTSATDSLLGTEAYAFDAVGNRTSSPRSSTYTHQPFNRLTATQTATYGHDSNGNTTSKVDGLSSWSYTWDRENRLTNASSGSASVDYVYDALGRRVKRIDGSDTTEFTHDGEDVVLDDSTISGTTKYQNGPGIDNKLSVKTGTNTSYLLADHLGSTDALTDGTGAVTGSQTYDSFGNGTNGAFPSRYQFTGREYDPTIGLQFSRARFYDPKLGRFISEDPIGFAGGDINVYGYVYNRPLALRDPTGNYGTIGAGTLAGMAFLLATSASPVNAPSRCDPVYFPDNPLLVNAAMGQALGMAGGYVYGRFISPYVGRLMAGMGDDIITLGLPKGPAPPPIASTPPRPMGVFRPETAGNFRHNLGVETGATPPGSIHAHHVFPREFSDDFISAGINQHHPRYGSWWEGTSHLRNASRYNLEWEEFLSGSPSRLEILAFGRDIMARYGQIVNY